MLETIIYMMFVGFIEINEQKHLF